MFTELKTACVNFRRTFHILNCGFGVGDDRLDRVDGGMMIILLRRLQLLIKFIFVILDGSFCRELLVIVFN